MKKIKKWFAVNLSRKIKLIIFWDKIKSNLVIPILLFLAYEIYSKYRYSIVSKGSISIFTDPFFSTLIAAILGGALAFYGSVYVQRSELQAKSSIRRRDEIYIPLYNEFLEIKRNLHEHPCPSNYKFSKQEGYLNDPQFLIWNKFKNDYKILEVPKVIGNALDEYLLLIGMYLTEYKKAVSDHNVESAIKKIIIQNSVEDNSNRNDLIYRYLPCNRNLNQIKIFLQSDLSKIEKGRQVHIKTDNEIDIIAQTIYKECSKFRSVQELQKYRKQLDEKNDELINVLGKIIIYVNDKYDQRIKLF